MAIAHNLIGAELAGHFVLVGRARDGDGLEAGRLGILQSQVAQSTNSDHSDSFVRLRIGPTQAAPDRVARAEDRRGLLVRKPLGEQRGCVRISNHVFGMTARYPYSRADLFPAKHRFAALTPFAPTA